MEESLPTIRRIVRETCRRRRLDPYNAEDFESYVMLKLIENDYHRLREYQGKSSLAAYLTTVTQRLFLDYLVAKWGKWRPSAGARALGPVAMELEKLVGREGFSFDEACNTMQSNPRFDVSEAELRELLPKVRRERRAREVGSEHLETAMNREPEELDDRVRDGEASQDAAALESQLVAALARLPEEERLLLRLRFSSKLTAKRIGLMLGERPSRIFTRLTRILKRLRRELEARGIQAHGVSEVLQWKGFQLDLATVLAQSESSHPRA